ncbi:haloacid dehalogenase-like hydrolase family protein [Mycobacterium kansasii 824]|nr:haloacid dehalogenase-like hydrolase family protein [Mycobacterium kansasii 824]
MRAAVAGGATFILATGRPPRWVRPVVDALGFAPMAVCANGAVIYDPATDRVVSAHTLSVDALAALAEIARRVIPGSGWPSSASAIARTTRRHHSSSVRRATSMPG